MVEVYWGLEMLVGFLLEKTEYRKFESRLKIRFSHVY